MTIYSIRAKIEPSPDVEFIDSALCGLRQGTVKLEQKVTQLFEKLRDPVYRYLVTTFGNPAQAEEITQEAFLELYRRLQSGQTVDNARAWIFRVAHNLAVKQIKYNDHFLLVDTTTWDDICELLQDPGHNPEQSVLEQERLEKLHAAFGALSSQQRQCLLLRAEGFRYREIAEILQIDISSVAEFLRRGIRKLMVQNNG